MRKSVFKYSLLILCPLLITVGYTAAWFSGQAVSSQNVMKSGTLILKDPGQIILDSEYKNIYPGWNSTKVITLQNKGTLPMRCKMSVKSDEKNIMVSGDNGIKAAINNIEDGRYAGKHVKLEEINNIYIGTIQPGTNRELQMNFSLPEMADNNYSGLSCKLKFYFDAIQEDSPLTFSVDNIENMKSIMKNVKDGDILKLGSEPLNGEIIINKSVTIDGDNKNFNDLTITMNPDKNQQVNITLNNMKLGMTNGSRTDYGVKIIGNTLGIKNIMINSIQSNNCDTGIYLEGEISSININNCKFDKNGRAIVQQSGTVKELKLNNCNFSNNSYDISCLSQINNLYLDSSTVGIKIWRQNNNTQTKFYFK